jgi:HEAT repeat protein
VEALGKIGPPVLPQLTAALEDANPRARGYAARALGGIDVDADLKMPLLVAMLRDEDVVVREMAATALVGLGDAAVPYLVETLADDLDWRARGHAALSLGRMIPPSSDAVSPLMAAIDDENQTVRQIACWSLGKAGKAASPAVEKLSRLLRSSDVGLRRTAAWALGNIGPAAAVARRALEGLLEDPDPTVREEADEALQKLRGTYGYTGATGEGK